MPIVTSRRGQHENRWLARLFAASVALSLHSSIGSASDGTYSDADGSPGNWRWWHIIWFQKDGNPRYASGSGNLSRNHQPRLMVRPPLCAPEYGYFQPCWRQLPVAPRCFTCETVPASFAVPTESGWPAAMPPSPSSPAGTAPPPSPALPAPEIPPVPAAPATKSPIGVGLSLPEHSPATAQDN